MNLRIKKFESYSKSVKMLRISVSTQMNYRNALGFPLNCTIPLKNIIFLGD